MQAMCIGHLLLTCYIAMCGHVVLLWMDFPNQMFASAHTFQIVSALDGISMRPGL